MSRTALNTQCPICGKQDSHHVIETNPNFRVWTNKIINTFFKQRVGGFLMEEDNAKVMFREHKRKCNYCYGEFTTLEISKRHIGSLINGYVELHQKDQEQLALIERLKSENTN